MMSQKKFLASLKGVTHYLTRNHPNLFIVQFSDTGSSSDSVSGNFGQTEIVNTNQELIE